MVQHKRQPDPLCETCEGTGEAMDVDYDKGDQPVKVPYPCPCVTLGPADKMGLNCPKCGSTFIHPACPLSGWYKCASKDCCVVFTKEGKVIKNGERIRSK